MISIATSYPRYDGDVIAPFIEHISHEIMKAGNHIDMLLPFHPDFTKTDEKNLRFHLYQYTRNPKLNIWGYAASMKADVKLKKWILLLAPSVYRAALRKAAELTKENRYDLIHAHWLLPNGVIGRKLARKLGIPLAVSLHGSDVTMAERPLFRRIARKILKDAEWVSACSEDLRQRVIALGADPEKTFTIPYGVDTEKFKPDTRRKARLRKMIDMKYRKGYTTILAVGRLVEKKGFTYLLDAMKAILDKCQDVVLVFAGDGDLKRELVSKTNRLGISKNVLFAGTIERKDLPIYFSGCDILAVPSVRDRYGNLDGLPNVLMEGLASGRAIVASRIAGIPNVMFDGENGLLVEPENPTELAEALDRLIEDPSLRKKLGREARYHALNRYTWKHTGSKYARGLASLVK